MTLASHPPLELELKKVIATFEAQFGRTRSQSIPCDSCIQTEDRSALLSAANSHAFRSVIGTLLFLSRDRPDLVYTVKELSSSMSKPACSAVGRLRKLIGYLKATCDLRMMLDFPTCGQRKWKSSEKYWILESFSDSDWSSHQAHRRSTSCGVHILNGGFLFSSGRTQRVVSLSSCENELHAMTLNLCDGIYLRRCIEFLVDSNIDHYLLVGSSSANQIAMKLGPGKLKHVAGQHFVMNGETSLVQPLPSVSGELSLRSRPRTDLARSCQLVQSNLRPALSLKTS